MDLPLQDLYAAGEGKLGTDEEKFISIIGTRSIEHLRKGEFVCASMFVWCEMCNLSPVEESNVKSCKQYTLPSHEKLKSFTVSYCKNEQCD